LSLRIDNFEDIISAGEIIGKGKKILWQISTRLHLFVWKVPSALWISRKNNNEPIGAATKFAQPAGYLSLTDILKLAEVYENYAVGIGYYFSSSQPLQWQEKMRAEGFARLKQFGYDS